MTVDQIAAVFRVTPGTVREWIVDGMPVKARGRRGAGHRHDVDLDAAVAWWFARNRERLELMRAHTQLASERARGLAMANRQRMSELGEFQVWRREVDRLFAEIRKTLLALPDQVAPLTGGSVNERKEALEAAIYEALRGLAHG